MTHHLATTCPDCDAPLLTGAEACANARYHARKVCDHGRELWAKMCAADEEGAAKRARALAALFYGHRAKCGACNAEVRT